MVSCGMNVTSGSSHLRLPSGASGRPYNAEASGENGGNQSEARGHPEQVDPAGSTGAAARDLGSPAPFTGRLALSVRETAATLGVCEKTVRRLINRRRLRASNALRHLLIPRTEVDRFLRETSRQEWRSPTR